MSEPRPTGGEPPAPSGCLFCAIAAGKFAVHEVHRDEHTVSFLDHRPVFPGHVLVIPKVHVDTLLDLPDELVVPFFTQARRVAAAVEEGLGAGGSFVAMNNRISQSVPHLHVHVVPRNRKDGLRGFFWPRTTYRDESHAAEVAATLRAVMGAGEAPLS